MAVKGQKEAYSGLACMIKRCWDANVVSNKNFLAVVGSLDTSRGFFWGF